LANFRQSDRRSDYKLSGWLDALDRRVTLITRRIAFAGVLMMLVIVFATVVDVLLRWVLNAPIGGFNEIVSMGLAIAIAATFPAGAAQRVNLTVDFLSRRISQRGLAWLKVVGAVALLVFYALLSWRIGVYALELNARSAETLYLNIPMGPVIGVVSALLFISAIVQIVVLLVTVKSALGGRPDVSGWSIAQAAEGGVHAPAEPVAVSGRAIVATSLALIALSAILFAASVAALPDLTAWARSHPATLTVVMLFTLWLLMVLYVPLTAAMGLVGLAGTILMIDAQPALSVLGNEAVQFLTNSQVAVLPMFLMMGSFAVVAGLSRDIYELAHTLLAHRRGGLALATIGGCGGFGALTGSSLATVATIGRVALPEMSARGYSVSLATGCVAAGGTLGALVPPSIPLIFYALLTEQSIGILFVAAVGPALLAIALYMVTVAAYVRLVPDATPPRGGRATPSELVLAFKKAWGAILLLVLVVGGIYSGIYTETEAAAVGSGAAFLFALFRGKLTRVTIFQVMGETTATTAMIYLIISGVLTFSFFVGVTGLPQVMESLAADVLLPKIAVIVIILIIYLLLGAVMDSHSVLFITVPIVVPLVAGYGYDLVWWGVVMLMVLETGLITPPFGIHVFVLKGIAGTDVPLGTIFRGVMPFVISDLIKLALVVAFPAIAMWLPTTMMGR
jgi:tripartite ATP-independent transporter DctM subunit